MRLYEGPPRLRGRSRRQLYQTAWLLQRGRVRLCHGKTVVEAKAGEWVFARPVAREQSFSEDAQLLSIAIRAEWPDGRPLFDKGLSIALPQQRFPALLEAAHHLHAADRLPPGVERHLALHEALFAWTRAARAALAESGISADERPYLDESQQRILTTLESWPLERRYCVEELCRLTRLSRTHFERRAKTALGKTPKAYLNARRLSHARRALRHQPAKAVAVEIGFRHASTFSHWFKEQTGHAPGEYLRTPTLL